MAPIDSEADGPWSPEEAFAALGDETRLDILQTLGDADGALSFTELRKRVGYETAGNFSYHLDQLSDHFIEQTEGGYCLRRPGERVVEAVLSGAVTERPSVDRMPIDRSCPYCGAPVELSYRRERVTGFCTECPGVYGERANGAANVRNGQEGLLGQLRLPPAGVEGRSVSEIERAAWTWGVRDMIALANAVCPRCSGDLKQSAEYCPDHDETSDLCQQCGNRHAVQLRSRCGNCIFEHEGAFVLKFMTNTAFLSFITDHGLNPVTDHWEFGWEYTEHVNSRTPFDASFAFEIDGDVLTLNVDETLSVSEAPLS